MKKTLLIAAAALAAGIISTQAQVYSQNVVGYVNQPIPAGGYQIVGGQMVNGSDANATNGDVNVLLGAGLISSPVPATGGNPGQDPSLSTNSVLYFWTGAGYQLYYYFTASDATSWESAPSPGGWYTSAGSYASGVDLSAGKSSFIFNHSSSPLTLTTVGTVLQGTNVVTISTGYNLLCLQEPISTNPIVGGYGLPLTMTSSNLQNVVSQTPSTASNDTFYYWTGAGYQLFYYFNSADATYWENGGGASPVYPAGFYDQAGSPMPSTSYPLVNQGFFLYHSGAPILWTNQFTVQ